INAVGFNDAAPTTDFTIPVELLPASGSGTARTVGLAMANASGQTAAITMTLVSQSGQAVATTALSLANNSQTLMDLSNDPAFKTALPTGAFIGALIVSSSAPVSVIALGDDFGPFYAMPVMAGRT